MNRAFGFGHSFCEISHFELNIDSPVKKGENRGKIVFEGGNKTMDEYNNNETAERPEPPENGSREPEQWGNRQTVTLESRGGIGGKKNRFGGSGHGRPGLKIFLIILGLCLLLVMVSAVGCESSDDSIASSGPYIAALYVEGTIQSGNTDSFGSAVGYQHQWTLNRIDDMIGDANNRGIFLYVDSPGGGVYESDELYLKLLDYKKRTGNPVYVYMGATAASGGYYVAAAGDKIFANRNTWTGSIGVTIGTVYDISGFLERYGIKTQTITSGANKAMGSSVEPMTAEQRQIWQTLVNEAYDQFAAVVAEGRNLPIQRVKQIGDGRIYSAQQALDLGLIDKIGTLEEAIKDMKLRNSLRECEVIDVYYEDHSFWRGFLSGFAPSKEPDAVGSEAEAVLSIVQSQNQLPISYTCQWLDQ